MASCDSVRQVNPLELTVSKASKAEEVDLAINHARFTSQVKDAASQNNTKEVTQNNLVQTPKGSGSEDKQSDISYKN